MLGSEMRTVIPTGLTYDGMPNPRWWSFEDGRVNFGAVSAATTDLAKLLFLDFALVYSNDWFMAPFTAPAGTSPASRAAPSPTPSASGSGSLPAAPGLGRRPAPLHPLHF